MPSPTLSQVHANAPLTNLSVAYLAEQDGFFYTNVPKVRVTKASDSYYTWTTDAFRHADGKVRAPGDPPPIIGRGMSTSTYTCERYSLAAKIPDPIRAGADAVLDLDRQNTELVTRGTALKVETVGVAALFGSALSWGTGTQSNGTWDDANSTPIEDVKATKRAMRKAVGFRPNVMYLGAKVADDLVRHPDVMDAIKYGAGPGNPAMADEIALAKLFKLDRVVTLDASYDSAESGSAASNSFLADGESALLVYQPAKPGVMTPSAFYAFVWDEAGMGNDMGLNIKRYRNPEKEESDQVECNIWVNFVQISTALGYYWNNAVAGTA